MAKVRAVTTANLDTMHDFHPDAAGGPAFEPGLIDARGRLARLCKGAKAPGPSKQQKRNEKLQGELMRMQLREAGKPIHMPAISMPEPAPPPPPPPSASSADVIDAESQARRQAQKRTNAVRNTIFAGETRGLGALGGQRTLLG